MNDLTKEDLSKLTIIWKSCYPDSSLHIEEWMNWLSSRNQNNDIKRINETLDYFIEKKISFINIFKTNAEKHVEENYFKKYTNLSYVFIFTYLKENKLISDNEVPSLKLIDDFSQQVTTARFISESKIKLILSLDPTEDLLERFFSCYEEINKTYDLELSAQRKLQKTIKEKYERFILKSPNKDFYLGQIKKLCKGINSKNDDFIDIIEKEEYSFNFKILINNNVSDATQSFLTILDIYNNTVVKEAELDGLSVVSVKVNDNIKKGKLEKNFILLSDNKEKIEQYKDYIKIFNKLIISDAKNKEFKDNYNELFNKIKFRNNLDKELNNNNTSSKKIKL